MDDLRENESTIPRPIEHCYWVVPGKLLAGEYPRNIDEASSREKIAALTAAGVTAFIDLTGENDGLLPYVHFLETASHEQFPIRDFSVPDSPETTAAILDAIDVYLARGDLVYVHCWGGVGRTGVIVGCWLARHGYPGRAALVRLRELWAQCPKSACKASPETAEQARYIVDWAEDLAVAKS
ncbi:MAG: protein-tyrosine phosphatase family protein [Anaerolineae bacterium]